MMNQGKTRTVLTQSPPNHKPDFEQVPNKVVDKGMESVVGALRYLFVGLRVLILVLLFSFFFGAFLGFENFGGFFYIDEHEEAMRFRFGRLTPVTVAGETREVFGSGVLMWRWPYPVDVVRRLDTQRPVIIETHHYWPELETVRLDPMAAQMVDPEQGLRPGYDGYLLTGDTNIMHMTWMLTYRVVDPRVYYLNFNDQPIGEMVAGELVDRRRRGGEVMVRSLLEQAVLREVATWSVDEVWRRSRMLGQPSETTSPLALDMEALELETVPEAEVQTAVYREFLADVVRERLIQLVAETGLGIEVQEVNLLEAQPPRATLQAFLAVNEAAQEYRQTLDAARSYETRALAEARTRAAALEAEGEAYKSRIIARAEADAEVFEQIHKQYEQNPESVLVALYSDTLRSVLAKVRETYVMPTVDGDYQEVRLLLGPEAPKMRQDNQ